MEEVFIGDFKFHGNQVITQPEGVNETSWLFTIEARPLSCATFTWRGPRGEIIVDNKLEKYEKVVDGDQIKLVIKNVSVDDMGPYTFEVFVETERDKKNANETMALIVKKEPRVEISFDKNLVDEVGTESTISCNVKGYPIDKDSLEFYFYPCDNYKLCYPNQKQLFNSSILNPVNGLKDTKYDFQFTADIKTSAMVGGKVGCHVCNKDNPNCKRKEEFFFDIHETGFEITGIDKDKDIVEGDNVIMKCVASKLKYSKLTWFHTDRLKQMNESNENSEYTLIQTLIFDNITEDDKGKYTCEATKIENGFIERKSRTLYIYNIEEPSVRTTNLNGSILNITAENEFTLICDVTGQPQPVIEWFKNGQRLNESNTIEDQGKTLKLKNVQVKDSGEYSCVAKNKGGRVKLSATLSILEEPGFNLAGVGGSSAAGVTLLIVIMIMAWKIRKYNAKIRNFTAVDLQLFMHGDPNSIHDQLNVHQQADLLPYDK